MREWKKSTSVVRLSEIHDARIYQTVQNVVFFGLNMNADISNDFFFLGTRGKM